PSVSLPVPAVTTGPRSANSGNVLSGFLCFYRRDRRCIDVCQRQHFLSREPRGDLLNGEPAVLAAEQREIGYQDVDAGLAGERVAAALHDLWPVPAVAVLH